MPTLVVTSGPLEGRRIDITEELTIGREETDLELDDLEVSRRHARVRALPDGLEIEDLGSRNGVRVNGLRISGPTRLEDGAVLKLGSTTLAVELGAAATRVGSVDPQSTRAT